MHVREVFAYEVQNFWGARVQALRDEKAKEQGWGMGGRVKKKINGVWIGARSMDV